MSDAKKVFGIRKHAFPLLASGGGFKGSLSLCRGSCPKVHGGLAGFLRVWREDLCGFSGDFGRKARSNRMLRLSCVEALFLPLYVMDGDDQALR